MVAAVRVEVDDDGEKEVVVDLRHLEIRAFRCDHGLPPTLDDPLAIAAAASALITHASPT